MKTVEVEKGQIWRFEDALGWSRRWMVDRVQFVGGQTVAIMSLVEGAVDIADSDPFAIGVDVLTSTRSWRLDTKTYVFPRRFVLQRDEDETGVSGTGVVAEGVEFSDGVVALRWLGGWPTSVVFHERGIESVEHVHGHGGKTKVVWR